MAEEIGSRAVDLGDHTQRDRRLARVLEAVGRGIQERPQPAMDGQLSRIALELPDAGRVRAECRAGEGDRERATEGGVVEQRLGAQEERHGQCRRHRGAVDQRDALLGPQLVWGDGERVRGRDDAAVDVHEPVADERAEQVGERDDLAGGTAHSARHDRIPAGVQAVGDEAAERGGHPGVAAQEPGQAEQHRAAHDCLGQGRPEPGGPAGQDRTLEGRVVDAGELAVGQEAEPGGHAVGARPRLEVGRQRGSAALHRLEQPGRQRDRVRTQRDPAVEGQVELIVTLEQDGRHPRHPSPTSGGPKASLT